MFFMKNKTISLPDELVERLKSEDNASSLITQLLMRHYENNDVDVLKKTIETDVEKKHKILAWGKDVRELHARNGRDTDLAISAWMTGASFDLQKKWEDFLNYESDK
jgi:hypothetical protein